MTLPFEDYLSEFEARGDWSILDHLPSDLTAHYIKTGNPAAEKDRLIGALQRKAHPTELGDRIFDIVKNHLG